MQNANEWFANGNILYINGETKKVTKNNDGWVHISSEFLLPCTEIDTKIFSLVNKFSDSSRVLVHSLDTDVKMISVFYSAKHSSNKTVIIRSGSGLVPSYFDPKMVLNYMRNNYSIDVENIADSLEKHAQALLRCYGFFGWYS